MEILIGIRGNSDRLAVQYALRWIIEAERGPALSELSLYGVLVDHGRLLIGDADSPSLHSLDLATSWGDGVFQVVARHCHSKVIHFAK